MEDDYSRKNFLGVKMLGGAIRTYFHLGVKKKKTRNLVLETIFGNIRKI